MNGLRLAFSLLTVAPVRSSSPDRRTARAAMVWAPFVGLLVGFVAAGVAYLTRVVTDDAHSLAAVAGITTMALVSRGLHLDGLADTADGLGSMRRGEEAYAVMRRGDVGPLGVVTIVLVLLAQVASLTVAIEAGRGTCALLVCGLTSRVAATLSCTPRTPPLGSGLGALVVGAVPRAAALGVAVAAGAAAFGLGWMDEGVGLGSGLHALAATVLALALAHAVRAHCVRRLGGINGDALGAQVETAATVVLLVFASEALR